MNNMLRRHRTKRTVKHAAESWATTYVARLSYCIDADSVSGLSHWPCVPVCCYDDVGSPAGVGPSATLGFFSTLHTSSLIHQAVVFMSRSTQNGLFWRRSPSQSLGFVWKKTKPSTTKAYIHWSQEMYYDTKLETVSIAEPLQNQHMHRLPINLACNSGPVVYAYRLNFIWIAVLCCPCGE